MSDDRSAEGFSDAADPEEQFARSEDIVTNDAVAGETVEPGAGDGNDGPTGGAPAEAGPEYAENDLAADHEDVDLDE